MVTKITEWEGTRTRLVKLTGLPSNGSYAKRRGEVELVLVHQSAGNFNAGVNAAVAIARFHSAAPIYKTNPDGSIAYRNVRGTPTKWVIGGGRGWPGCGYTFVVPGVPETIDGKIEVYRVHDDDRHTYHTGSFFNRVGVAVCFAGTFKSRHTRDAERTREAPQDQALAAGAELILDYLLPRYGLDRREGLKGHFDAGKAACPGDFLEQWVRFQRGDDVQDPTVAPEVDPASPAVPVRDLQTVAARQQALVDLGFDLGTYGRNNDGVDGAWGERSKGALLAFQTMAGILVDGRWGPQTEGAMQRALQALGRGDW